MINRLVFTFFFFKSSAFLNSKARKSLLNIYCLAKNNFKLRDGAFKSLYILHSTLRFLTQL